MLQPFEKDVFIENFDQADLKDARLNNRLKKIATKMANKPEESISTQMESWKDTKACFRFFSNPNVTHKRIQTPHRKMVKALASKKDGEVVLFIQDLSELDYSSLKATKGLGQAGNQFGKGIQMHSCLAVTPCDYNPKVMGLAHQIVWERRADKTRKPSIGDQLRKDKESHVWSQTLKAIGTPPSNCTWVSICDRGCDSGKYFNDVKELGWETVARAFQNRCVKIKDEKIKLMDWMKSLVSRGTYTINIRKKGETKPREIKLKATWETRVVLLPTDQSESEVELSVIRCWNEEEDIDWVLYSTVEISNLEEAIEKIKWYAHRWIIEEYHKCVKTGCEVESRQLQTAKSLESIVGVLGIVALLMLSLRNVARDAGQELAKKYVPEIPMTIVCHRFELNRDSLTIYEFWRAVSRIGGFLCRKSDGEPGWQTLWSGWLQLLNMIEGASAFLNISKSIN